MNWIAYNYAHDVGLPGSKGPQGRLPHVPAGRDGGERLDSLDPDKFKYTITSREI